jgi:hypothetical protein
LLDVSASQLLSLFQANNESLGYLFSYNNNVFHRNPNHQCWHDPEVFRKQASASQQIKRENNPTKAMAIIVFTDAGVF